MTEPSGESPAVDETDMAALLALAGVDESEIDRAVAAGTLPLLAVETMILTDQRYDIDDVADETGISGERIATLWTALGFATPRPGERIFNGTDLEHLRAVADLVESNFADPEIIIQLTRMLGASMARIASLQAELVLSRGRASDFDADTALVWFGDRFGQVLEQVWRRHLQAAARARLSAPMGPEAPVQAVGFADLVGFTALSQQLDSGALAAVVDRFESVAYATVAQHGGRVVKMIGDEVMFTVDDPADAAQCALDLAESYHDADDLSDVRVGVAYGTVIDREGDLFGPPVNLASRMTSIAYPGSVLVDEAMYELLDEHPAFSFKSMLPRRLKHIGLVRLHVLREAGEEDQHRRQRRERRRARVAEMTVGLLPGGDDVDE
ncbi:adenylate/guanylate cyclase domain-containing protein [Actinospongicola halichondriae]|uniref:adenylate/guanylate cyclase domain-containing protein n=1 Tax=Actinospongicola halichondriae TaxID=3236844 RepID=UPI003D4A12B4